MTINKTIITGFILFTLAAAGAIMYLAGSQPKTNPTRQSAQKPGSSVPQGTAAKHANSQQSGTFIVYDREIFASTSGTRILFFHAPWCFQCRELEKDINANLDKIPAGVTIFKIDYDSNQDLRRKYSVKMQTTFVVFDAQGNAAKNFVAYDKPNFANLKDNIFNLP